MIDSRSWDAKGGRFGQPACRGIVRGDQNRHTGVMAARHIAHQRQHV
jgi:hypothetical protein